MFNVRVNLVCTEVYMKMLEKDCKLQLPVKNCLRVTNLGRPDKYISYNKDVTVVPQGFNVYTLEICHENRDVIVLYRNYICKCIDETTRSKKSGLLYSEVLDISRIGYKSAV